MLALRGSAEAKWGIAALLSPRSGGDPARHAQQLPDAPASATGALHRHGWHGICTAVRRGEWSMPLCLSTSTVEAIQHPSDAVIRGTLAALPSLEEPFAILETSPGTYVQAYWSEDGFELEFQEGTVDRHYRVARCLSRDEAVDAFLRLARDEPPWVNDSVYQRLNPTTWEPDGWVMIHRFPIAFALAAVILTPLRAAYVLFRRCCRRGVSKARGNSPGIRLPNADAESNYIVRLNCKHCGGALRNRRGRSTIRPDGWICTVWKLKCRQCRKTENAVTSIPGPDAIRLLATSDLRCDWTTRREMMSS
jgi:hypothetical protein